MTYVRPPYALEWQEGKIPSASMTAWVDFDRPREFQFGFGLAPEPGPVKKKRKKKKS